MKGVVYKLDRAIITIVADITEESMVGLVDEIDRLTSEYFYKSIELRISSPGGLGLALDYYLEAIQTFRRRGIEIRTRALTQACSAGAALLSLGDGPREAGSGSILLYHCAQIPQEHNLTARKAEEMQRFLSQADRKMTRRIAARAFEGYGPGSKRKECTKPRERRLDAFSEMDWRIMNRLAGQRIGRNLSTPDEDRKACLAALRERVAKECEQKKDVSGFCRLYEELFDLDTVMTAALACELRLIDRLVDEEEALPSVIEPDRRANTIQIPEWHSLFSPDGRIERAALCRHTMIFGETGSGKTQSAILPVLRAILRQAAGSYQGDSPVSCALVIDPKKELLPILTKEAPEGVVVRALRTSEEGEDGLTMDLMSGAWSIEKELAANDVVAAALKILKRCASFLPKNAAFAALLGRGGEDNSYWKGQGIRLAQTMIGLLLTVLKFRGVIYDPKNLNPMAPYPKAQLRAFGEVAGFLAPGAEQAGRVFARLAKALAAHQENLEEEAKKKRWARSMQAQTEGEESPETDDESPSDTDHQEPLLSAEWQWVLGEVGKPFFESIRASIGKNATLRRQVNAKSKAFAALLKDPSFTSASDLIDQLKATAESCWDLACPLLPDDSVGPCRNLMALASKFQQQFFVAGSGHDPEEEEHMRQMGKVARGVSSRVPARRRHVFLAHRVVEECLREILPVGPGLGELYDDVDYFHGVSVETNDNHHYGGLFAFAKPSFEELSESVTRQALFFGYEPFLEANRGDDFNLFAGAINSENGGTIFVYQPSLGYGQDTLIARVLKAQFFETVLNDKQRQQNGSEMPLVAYVADEFHRFITSDVVHGEQSFFDTCRSFGAFCAVASQSMSSLHHALAGDHYTNKDEKAVEILLNNTGTKLFFRTTDGALHDTIDRLCPMTPGLPKATQVRPPSSLRPGECYAVVTDGRFMRCRIDLNAGAGD